MVTSRIKQLAYLLIAAFVIYAIFKSPDQAASIVRPAWNGIVDVDPGDRPVLQRPAEQQQQLVAMSGNRTPVDESRCAALRQAPAPLRGRRRR